MAMTETVELLGKGLYNGKIPDTLTIKSIPTSYELEAISAEDFDKTMLDKILPKCVDEKINFNDLFEYDYHWLLRCLRILNFGPYIDTNLIICPECGRVDGDFQCDLRAVECIPFPEKFTGSHRISRNEFMDYNQDIVIRLLTIKEALNSETDPAFTVDGVQNQSLARKCYMISEFGTDKGLTPIEVKLKIEKELSPADYVILNEIIRDEFNFGLRAGGHCKCPKCGADSSFLSFVNERFFRPSLANLRAWKADRVQRKDDDADGIKGAASGQHTR